MQCRVVLLQTKNDEYSIDYLTLYMACCRFEKDTGV